MSVFIGEYHFDLPGTKPYRVIINKDDEATKTLEGRFIFGGGVDFEVQIKGFYHITESTNPSYLFNFLGLTELSRSSEGEPMFHLSSLTGYSEARQEGKPLGSLTLVVVMAYDKQGNAHDVSVFGPAGFRRH